MYYDTETGDMMLKLFVSENSELGIELTNSVTKHSCYTMISSNNNIFDKSCQKYYSCYAANKTKFLFLWKYIKYNQHDVLMAPRHSA